MIYTKVTNNYTKNQIGIVNIVNLTIALYLLDQRVDVIVKEMEAKAYAVVVFDENVHGRSSY
ncbi:hypothetical protein MUGA111182_15480 [Mucilaginibacter galii]|uniref:Uncharacterized protein n=1 Tax=Mucilaginibacter galii TaxID=2005073 RepID=A0A917JEB4_9SPHI|nr:hypothetical protein [Mucilaginibacter galii]GGI52526.1 hypothetical protein GCM10011425_37380 [Mucilaginibacter galii]